MTFETDRQDIYLVGDFFVKDKDLGHFHSVQGRLNNLILLANFEMSPLPISHVSNKIKLGCTTKVVDALSKYPNLYFSILNNHFSDATRNGNKLRDASKNLQIIQDLDDLLSAVNFKGHEFIFLGDVFEDVSLPFPFLKFSNSTIDQLDVNKSHVVVHGGLEYREYPTYRQRYLSHKLIDKGALSVSFHHSHVQGVTEHYKGRLIHYGLGNYIFSAVSALHGVNEAPIPTVHIDKFGNATAGSIIDDKFVPASTTSTIFEDDYRSFYRRKYPLNGSFRPRQLRKEDFANNVIFYCWVFVAKTLVEFGLSKKIKLILNKIIKLKN